MRFIVQNSTIRLASLVVPFLLGLNGCSAQTGSAEETIATASANLDITRFHGWNQIPIGILTSAPAVTFAGGATTAYGAADATSSTGIFEVVGQGTDNTFYINIWE